jgi:probable FeS assembly SUF system protein SufT
MSETVTLNRDCEASVVPMGTRVTLQKGEQAHIAQSLGGSYTVIVNGNMFRIEGKDADALGKQQAAIPTRAADASGEPIKAEELEQKVWEQMRSCYDPEIPVNIADLGLIYDCQVTPLAAPNAFRVVVKMTLTAPGCGMGPTLRQDVENKIMCLEGAEEVQVDLVWEPPWNQGMMTEAARLQLGLL